jgi:hypothetical protein
MNSQHGLLAFAPICPDFENPVAEEKEEMSSSSNKQQQFLQQLGDENGYEDEDNDWEMDIEGALVDQGPQLVPPPFVASAGTVGTLEAQSCKNCTNFSNAAASVQGFIQQRAKEKIGLANLGSELICAICQELFVEASTIECGHSFCRMCIENWLKTKLSCPICRHPIEKPPISSVCLDKAVRVMLELIEEKQTASELLERQKQATKARESECFAQSCLETLFQKAVQQGVRVVHISKQWSPREQQRFLGGIERHQGVAREAYCRVVGLTYEWIGRASMEELLVAAANVMLKDMENKPRCHNTWKQTCVTKVRARLDMYVRYG